MISLGADGVDHGGTNGPLVLEGIAPHGDPARLEPPPVTAMRLPGLPQAGLFTAIMQFQDAGCGPCLHKGGLTFVERFASGTVMDREGSS